MKQLSVRLTNLRSFHFNTWFSAKELTDILRDVMGVTKARRALSDLENHGVIEFRNARTCRFCVAPTVENIQNIITL